MSLKIKGKLTAPLRMRAVPGTQPRLSPDELVKAAFAVMEIN
jgi:hypothetical protein